MELTSPRRNVVAEQYDMNMILITHQAFRRDLRRLAAAAERLNGDPRRRHAVALGWKTLQELLHSHHVGEDTSMWPRMRTGLSAHPDDLAVLDAMEDEHRQIEPLMAAVDKALREALDGAADGTEPLAAAAEEFADAIIAHLQHEERAAFPLVRVAMTPDEWSRSRAEMRGGLAALRAAPEFFPWLLDEAAPADRDAVLSRMPPPLRLLYRRVWLPRYQKQPRW
jgi:hemerythrin-like domain-containing protein